MYNLIQLCRNLLCEGQHVWVNWEVLLVIQSFQNNKIRENGLVDIGIILGLLNHNNYRI